MATPSSLEISYDSEHDLCTVRWLTDSSMPSLQAEYEAVLAAEQVRRTARWLLDVRRRPLPTIETANWVSFNWLPRAAELLAPAQLCVAYLVSNDRAKALAADSALQANLNDALAPNHYYQIADYGIFDELLVQVDVPRAFRCHFEYCDDFESQIGDGQRSPQLVPLGREAVENDNIRPVRRDIGMLPIDAMVGEHANQRPRTTGLHNRLSEIPDRYRVRVREHQAVLFLGMEEILLRQRHQLDVRFAIRVDALHISRSNMKRVDALVWSRGG